MEKLGFLAGSWAGEALVLAGGDGTLTLNWTEEVQFKLDGLLLAIEARGVSRTDGRVVRQALGLVAYDDFAGVYRMRTFNDGRYLETELKLLDGGVGFTWGFEVGEFKTSSLLAMNEKGEWTELHHLTTGSQPPRKMMEVRVERVRS